MTTKAMKVWGSTVTFDGVSIGEIIDLGRGNPTRNIIRVFTTDSDDEAAEKISSGVEPGQVTFRCVYDGEIAGQYHQLHTKFWAGTIGTLLRTYSNGATVSASAIIANIESPGGAAEGGVQEYSITFDISGALTHTGVA